MSHAPVCRYLSLSLAGRLGPSSQREGDGEGRGWGDEEMTEKERAGKELREEAGVKRSLPRSNRSSETRPERFVCCWERVADPVHPKVQITRSCFV